MDEMKKILDELQGAVLAVEELNSTVPDVQVYYNECKALLVQLDKRKEAVSALIEECKLLKEEIKKQSAGTSRELEARIEKATSQIEAALKKIEGMQGVIESKIKDIPSIEPLKKKVAALEKEIKRIDETIDNLESEVTEEDLYDLREELLGEMEERFNALQKEIKQNTLMPATGAARGTGTNTPVEGMPTGYLSCSLSDSKNVSRKKPYGVLFEETGIWVKASHWTVLSEKMTIHIIENYARDGGKFLRESDKDDGWGHYYFMDGDKSDYKYISKYRIGVYKAGANDSLKIYKYMCDVYGINKNKVKVFYK